MTGHFDPQTHTYTIDGKTVPSVTQVVRRFAPFPVQVDSWYLQRGTMVHKACALLVTGELEDGTVDPRIVGYVNAAHRFLDTYRDYRGIERTIVERQMFDKHGQFAGTFDAWINGELIDWKSSDDPATEIQLGGYVSLLQPLGAVRKCKAVELHEDGTFKVTPYEPKRCLGLWRAALSVYQWQEANGYGKQNERN